MNEGVVERKVSASGASSYSDPIILRDSGTTHIELVPSYIPRSKSPDNVSLKIKYWKKSGGELRDGYPVDFSLNNKEFEILQQELIKIASIAGQSDSGKYLILRVDEEDGGGVNVDASTLGSVIRKIAENDDSLRQLAADPEGESLVRAVQISTRAAELRQAIDELVSMLDSSPGCGEQEFQKWMERHSWALGDEYSSLDSVRKIGIRENVDLLVERSVDGLRDVVELKLPSADPIKLDRSHHSWYWTSEAAKAIGQCHRYLDRLHENAKDGLIDHKEIVSYHPRATIVQGRSRGKDADWIRGLHGLNARLHSIQVITYDQLILRAKKTLGILESGRI